MGTEGMKASLISRELIADSIELSGVGYAFDAAVILVGCDKTIPAAVMALGRLNIPGLVLYSGSNRPGRRSTAATSRSRTCSRASGSTPPARSRTSSSRRSRTPPARARGPAARSTPPNTMAMAVEFMGLAPMGSGSVGATDRRKDRVGYDAGVRVMDLLERGVLPRGLITRESIENGIVGAAATGGSTNVVLHLLAIARESGIALDIEDFDTISERTPLIGDLRPGGRYVALDLDRAGGVRLVAQRLVEAGKLTATS